MAISNNKLVKIHYKGTLNDGTVFDSSEGKEPLEFIYGVGMIIPGLEKGIEGLEQGQKKTIEVKADDAYGPIMEQAVQEVPKDQFPQDVELKEGMQLAAQGPQGVIPVKVKEIKEDSVLVDFNHPLAGQDLKFDVEVIEEKDASEEDKKRILEPLTGASGCADGSCAGCTDDNCASKPSEASDSLEDSLDNSSDEEKKE
jgi:peptidylprolyl isomerase